MMQVRCSAFLLAAVFVLHVFLLQKAVTESKMLPAASGKRDCPPNTGTHNYLT